MTRASICIAVLALVGCSGAPDDPCAAARAKIATCFPEHATVAPACDPEIAAEIAESTCDELAARDGKEDGFTCFWMPWLCTGGGTTGSSIEVSVEECGGGPDALCPFVTGASCGLVTLHDTSGDEIARGFSRESGRFTFDGLSAGAYRVKVRDRSNGVVQMRVSEFTADQAPASLDVVVGGGDTPWARFELITGEADAIDQCAELAGGLTVKDGAGNPVAGGDVEWEWIVELETAGEVIERTRPLASASSRNLLRFRMLRPGAYTVRFVRMEIPSFERRPNPDYDRLRDRYAANVAPIEFAITIRNADRNRSVALDRTIVDPLR